MSEGCSKSRLKRKKWSVKELQTETCPLKRGQTADTDRSVVPAAAVWWNRQQLPAAESLWAFMLTSALPFLENQPWDLVPDLPHSSAARPTVHTLDEQLWCDLSTEVPPFPDPSPPSPRISSSSVPLRLGSPQQDLSVQCRAVPDRSDRWLSAHSKQSPDLRKSPQPLSKRQQPSFHQREEASSSSSSSAGPLIARGEGIGAVSNQLLTDSVSDSLVPLQEGENKEEVVEVEEEEEEEEVWECRRSIPGDGGGSGLQSCPMCLQVFPVGFTQMDCDGHLAQCLSVMNVDITW